MLLAGGAATRFGGFPKGLSHLGDRRIADLALDALDGAADDVLIVANDAQAVSWFPGRSIVADAEPGLGPLAGLITALRAAQGASTLVVAWDMPFVPSGLLRSLRKRGEVAGASVVPVHGPLATPEPLCAYYRPEALPVAERLLGNGERRARALYERLAGSGGAITMSDRGLDRFGEPDRLFASIDTPGDLVRLRG